MKDYDYLQVCCHSEECNLAYVTRELTITHTQVIYIHSCLKLCKAFPRPLVSTIIIFVCIFRRKIPKSKKCLISTADCHAWVLFLWQCNCCFFYNLYTLNQKLLLFICLCMCVHEHFFAWVLTHFYRQHHRTTHTCVHTCAHTWWLLGNRPICCNCWWELISAQAADGGYITHHQLYTVFVCLCPCVKGAKKVD